MVFFKTPLNGFMIFFEVLGFEPVDFQTRLVVGSPRSLIRGQGKRIWHWHVPNIGKLGFKLGPSSSFRDWNRLFSTMAGNGGFKALSNLGLGSELRINVYIQQKMDQLWNLAPPPNVMCMLGQELYYLGPPSSMSKPTFLIVRSSAGGLQKRHLISGLKTNSFAPPAHVKVRSLLPWLTVLCFKTRRYQTCRASTWVIMRQYCNRRVWQRKPIFDWSRDQCPQETSTYSFRFLWNLDSKIN